RIPNPHLLERREQVGLERRQDRFGIAAPSHGLFNRHPLIERSFRLDLVIALLARVARGAEAIREEAEKSGTRAVEAEILWVGLAGLVMQAAPDIVGRRAFDSNLGRTTSEKEPDELFILLDEPQFHVAELGRANCF